MTSFSPLISTLTYLVLLDLWPLTEYTMMKLALLQLLICGLLVLSKVNVAIEVVYTIQPEIWFVFHYSSCIETTGIHSRSFYLINYKPHPHAYSCCPISSKTKVILNSLQLYASLLSSTTIRTSCFSCMQTWLGISNCLRYCITQYKRSSPSPVRRSPSDSPPLAHRQPSQSPRPSYQARHLRSLLMRSSGKCR